MNSFDNTNPQLWKWGIFYNNPNDDRLIVQKRSGLGWTFNFAHKSSYLFMIAFVVIVLVGVYFFN